MASKKNQSTMQWKVDIADLKKSMKEAKTSLSLANAEFKAATAGMKNWKQSAEGVEAKLKQLKTTLQGQEAVLANLNKQYEITARELGADSDEAKKLEVQIKNQEAAIIKTNAEIQQYNTDLGRLQKEEAEANTELGKLTKKISEQEDELERLRKEYKNAVLTYGENSKEAKALASQIGSLSGELAENKQKMADAEAAADKLSGELDEVGDSAKKASDDGFSVMKATLADLASSAIKACIQGLKDLAGAAKEAWSEFDEGRDIITRLTGATGESAAEIQNSYKKVAKTVNADLTTVGKAIGEVNTRFGATGQDLEDLATLFIKFANINDTDVKDSVDDVQKAMSAYGLTADQAESFLDRLTLTAQQTGVATNSLTSGIISNATAFQEMGISVDQAVILMGQLEKSGANSETVLNGMRKALKSSAKEGISINEALSKLQDTIISSKNSTDGLNAAYDTFGKSGDQIYGVIKNGTLNFKELSVAADDAAGTVTNTFNETQDAGDEFKLAMQGIKIDLADTAEQFLRDYGPQISKAIEKITKAISKLIPKIAEAIKWITKNGDKIISILAGIVAGIAAFKAYTIITSLIGVFQTFFGVIAAGEGTMAALNAVMAANPIGIIIGLIAGLVAAFITLWNTSEEFREFFIGMWEAIKETVGEIVSGIVDFFKGAWEAIQFTWSLAKEFFADIWEGIKKTFSEVADWFKEKFEAAWNGIKTIWDAVTGFFSDIWEGIKGTFNEASDWLSGVFSDAWDAISGVWDAVTGFFSDIWEGIKGVFTDVTEWFSGIFQDAVDAVKLIFDGLVSIIKAPLNLLIDGINLFIRGLNHIQIPDWVPGVGGLGLNFDEIPNLQKGGVLKRGQIGFLEGNGAEAVVPLEKNKAWISAVAKDLKAVIQTEGLGGISGKSETNNNYNYTQVINSPKAVDRLTLYRQTNSLLFTAQVRAQNA